MGDDTGSISSDDLSRLLQVSGAELISIMTGADLNGDGVIDFEEFKAIFTRLAPRVSSNDTRLSLGTPGVESPACIKRSGPAGDAPNSSHSSSCSCTFSFPLLCKSRAPTGSAPATGSKPAAC